MIKMPKVKEISVSYSTDGLGADERGVIEYLKGRGNIECTPGLFDNKFIVSAKGVGIEHIHNVVNDAVEAVKNLEAMSEAEPLDTSVSFRVNASLEKIERFAEEIENNIEGIHAWNVGYVLTVSSDVFDEKHLIDCVGKHFDIV